MSAYSPKHSARSLIYIKNKSGITLVTSHHLEELRLTLTVYFLAFMSRVMVSFSVKFGSLHNYISDK